MEISIQYLEATPARAAISAAEARGRLKAAFEHVHFNKVMLGWDLHPSVVAACAEECERRGADLYLWQPIFTGHGAVRPGAEARVVALDGNIAGEANEQVEFSFLCANRFGVTELIEGLSKAVRAGPFNGIFLDRIRLPSPAMGIERHLGCFCEACQEAASKQGLDLEATRLEALRQLKDREGRRAALACLLGENPTEVEETDESMQRLVDFRAACITAQVKSLADAIKGWDLKVGLDCFAPTLTQMVGQDLRGLADCADWIKVMTYVRAFGQASIPFEVLALTDWLMAGGESEASALEFLSAKTGWDLPGSRKAIRSGGLPASILTEELRRGRRQAGRGLLAGIELLEIPDVSTLNRVQIQHDAAAVQAGNPDGVVLSWDLWHMPEWRLELARSLYGDA